MPKKFFDIIPPQENKDGKISHNSFIRKLKEKNNFVEPKDTVRTITEEKLFEKTTGNKDRKNLVTKISLFVLFLMVVLMLVSFVSLGVKIELYPKLEPLNLKTNVTIRLENDGNSLGEKEIKGKLFEYEKTTSRDFSSSGEAFEGKRAEGIIRVFNNYSTSAQPLLINTRFVSNSGMLFRSTKREVIPGGHYEKKKFVPGFKDIKVRAAEPGKKYNIGPSIFSIPGFRGTPKYTYFYGKSFSSMKGGFKGKVPQVTEDDIKKAQLSLFDKLKEENKNSLKKIVSKDYALLDNAIFQNIAEENNSSKVGDKIKSFSVSLKVKSFGIAFKKSDMDKFIRNFIALNIPKNKKIKENSLKISYSLNTENLKTGNDVANNLKNKDITVSVSIKAMVYQKIDLIGIKKAVSGKSIKEAKMLLKELPYIENVKIETKLPLKRKIPDDIKKINVKLIFEK